MSYISQELSNELASAARALIASWGRYPFLIGPLNDLRMAIAKFPAPVDPDLAEAREELATFYEAENACPGGIGTIRYEPSAIADIRAGRSDDTAPVRFALLSIKRGRELEHSK